MLYTLTPLCRGHMPPSPRQIPRFSLPATTAIGRSLALPPASPSPCPEPYYGAMNTPRQERKSCEACRTRKLRCSGEKSGCSRCRDLSLPCRFNNQGAPGRPRKRVRQDQPDRDLPNREKRINASHFSTAIPQTATVNAQETANMLIAGDEFEALSRELAGNCGFDALDWEILGNGDLRSFPIELSQASRQNESFPMPSDAYVSPASFSGACKCDEEVSDTVRNLNRADISHDIIQMLRTGVSLVERLLTCPICYDVSKPPRVTVQNVLLIGQLMFEITSGYQKYLRWLKEHCTDLDAGNESETVYLNSGLGIASGFNLQISGQKLRHLVVEGLQADAERLLALGKQFGQRQYNRHMIGHEACLGPEGRCRKKEYAVNHDPLDLCPHNPSARKLVPCFRIVDEVRGMIKEVADAVA